MAPAVIHSGIPALDEVLRGLRPGDNIVWQVDSLDDYRLFAEPFAEQAIRDGRDCVYLRFAPHAPVLRRRAGVFIVEVDPSPGFDSFTNRVQRLIQERGRGVLYVFDNLSSLVEEWATDEQLANFFQVTCPYLFELDTVTYFALLRGQHDYEAIARIRDTTQVLIDVYHAKGAMYVHPLKVWDRYSPHMFLPHLVSGDRWAPVFQSGEAAEVSVTAHRRPLGTPSSSIAPWETVYRKLVEYRQAGLALPEAAPETMALKQELSRMMLGSHPEFLRLADAHFTLDDLLAMRDRLIGSGRIGGKAAGMLLARRILAEEQGEIDFSQVLEDHDSFFIGSDVFFTFLVNNHLFRLRFELSRAPSFSAADFAEVEGRFLAGGFPGPVMEQFREMLAYFGQAPIIVRSSSFLEDSFGNAFAGKYRSEFCPNQGSPEARLDAFLRAVKLVYASALNPDALAYRRRRGLGESDEQMAILVQRVSGTRYRDYFFPTLAGVAFSRNLYAWTDRIDRAKGVIRLVFGLGTRAVNRVGGDYTRMIAVSHPELRPESGSEIARYSQHQADVLDLAANEFATVPVRDLLADLDYPNLRFLVSLMADGHPYDPVGSLAPSSPADLILTFNNLIQHTQFVRILGELLERLERAYDHPIDTEFTAAVDARGRVRVNLLQCRPMWLPGASDPVVLPAHITRARTLFRAARLINGGTVPNIRYIVYIDPRQYATADIGLKRWLGRVVGQVNKHPHIAAHKALVMGPGRWGSSNIELGVNVSYGDIDNAAVLVELACEEAGHVPEVSYGTHFFQDLVEAQIIYLPVYPDDPGAEFNHAFFSRAHNSLADLVPEAGRLGDLLRVIDVPMAASGAYAHVAADAQNQRALCYLE